MTNLARRAAAGALGFALACGGGGGDGGTPPVTEVTRDVGPAGGAVALPGGPTVTIPPNALGAVTPVTIRTTAGTPLGALGPLYEFLPDGTAFSAPVAVALPVPAGTTAATVYWTRPGSASEYDALPTTVSGTTATATASHFSGGYVGLPGVRALAGCIAQGAARMYALVGTFDGILRSVEFQGQLPPGVVELPPTVDRRHFAFDSWAERVTAQMYGEFIDEFPVNKPMVFDWTLAREGQDVGTGKFSFTRVTTDWLQVHIVDQEPHFDPSTGCTASIQLMGLSVRFTSEPLSMEPEGSLGLAAWDPRQPEEKRDLMVTTGSALHCPLGVGGSEGWAGVAALSGRAAGRDVAFRIDLRDATWWDDPARTCP